MPPLNAHFRWRPKYFYHFPIKRLHRALKQLMAARKIHRARLINAFDAMRTDQGVVGAQVQHVGGVHGWAAIEVEGVGVLGDRSPLLRIDFVRSFLLPILDQVLDERFDGGRCPGGRLGRFEGRVVQGVVGRFFVAPLSV